MKKHIVLVLICFALAACQPDKATPAPADAPAPSSTPPSAQTQPIPTKAGLSDSGPWIFFAAENGLWAMNEDGSALTQLTTEHIVAPADIKTGHSVGNPYFAYITASDPSTLQGLKLNLLMLPEGSIKTITPLTSPETEPQADAEICDPNYEAARTVTIGNSLRWSPDGSQLAFTGSMQGATADVYVYSLEDETITRLSDESGQAYDLHWHWPPDSETIVYFSASCFGTGAGFNMEGAWAVDTNTSKTEKIYEPSMESWGENFITWARSGQESFFVSAISGCPQRDLRLVDIPTKEIKTVFEGCFEDIAVGPTGSLAVLTSKDFSEQPGLYIYAEPDIVGIPAVYAALDNGRKVRYASSQFLVSVVGEGGEEVRSFTWDGGSGWYQGKGNLPTFAPGGEVWAWNENGAFKLGSKENKTTITLSNAPVMYALWHEEVASSGEIRQRLYFFSGDNSGKLFMASDPDYAPTLLAGGFNPLAAPVIVSP